MKNQVIGYIKEMRALMKRNVILIILINMLNQYGNLMKNSYRSLFAMQDVGVAPTVLGAAVSMFLIVSIICRIPAGVIVDTRHRILKPVLGVAFILKAAAQASFLLVHDAGTMYLAFAADAVAYAFLGVAMPAMLALTIDKKAVGRGYAIMIGVGNILTAHARALGVTMYNKHGLTAVVCVTVAISIAAFLLCMLMDSAPLLQRAEQEELLLLEQSGGKRGRKGVLVKMLPLAITAAMPIIMYQAETNFLVPCAEAADFDYLGALGLAGTLDGINTIIVGFLCDVVSPGVFIVVGLLGCAAGTLIFSTAATSSVFCAGILIYYCTQNYDAAFRIMGMKLVSTTEQGSLQATMITCNEVLSVICAPLLGAVVERTGYAAMWRFACIWILAALAAFIVLDRTILRSIRREKKPAEIS